MGLKGAILCKFHSTSGFNLICVPSVPVNSPAAKYVLGFFSDR